MFAGVCPGWVGGWLRVVCGPHGSCNFSHLGSDVLLQQPSAACAVRVGQPAMAAVACAWLTPAACRPCCLCCFPAPSRAGRVSLPPWLHAVLACACCGAGALFQ